MSLTDTFVIEALHSKHIIMVIPTFEEQLLVVGNSLGIETIVGIDGIAAQLPVTLLSASVIVIATTLSAAACSASSTTAINP